MSSVPVTQFRRKSLQVLRFSHDLIRLFTKKVKKLPKKNNFPMILLAIILLPLKDQFWIMAKLRQFSHFSQQIIKSEPFHFQKSKRELRVYFRSFVNQISINQKLRSNMTGKVGGALYLTILFVYQLTTQPPVEIAYN